MTIDFDIAILILRLIIGLLFMGHGAQKLFGWFGGGGIEGTAGFFGHLNVHPPRFWATMAGLSEFFGGAGLALGLLTPVAAAAIIGVMLMAIIRVHWSHGPWISDNGYEYALVNLVVAAVIGLTGPGRYSLDALLSLNYPVVAVFAFALAAVLLGVLAGLVSGQTVQQTNQQHEAQG